MSQLYRWIEAEIARVIRIYRDDSQIWGCIGGVDAYTPPYLGTSPAIPIEPVAKVRLLIML
jgi:hypothetical protein